MLSRMLKLPLSQLHREAHHIEHSISPEVAECLQEEMKDPRFCPYGDHLPGFEGEAEDWIPLSEIELSQTIIVRHNQENLEDDNEILTFLESKDWAPGVKLQVIDRLPLNETINLQIKGRDVILGLCLVADIFVIK
jgi:DtxR family transcriptional regulator, Mn-dependent transcriptional regulator